MRIDCVCVRGGKQENNRTTATQEHQQCSNRLAHIFSHPIFFRHRDEETSTGTGTGTCTGTGSPTQLFTVSAEGSGLQAEMEMDISFDVIVSGGTGISDEASIWASFRVGTRS